MIFLKLPVIQAPVKLSQSCFSEMRFLNGLKAPPTPVRCCTANPIWSAKNGSFFAWCEAEGWTKRTTKNWVSAWGRESLLLVRHCKTMVAWAKSPNSGIEIDRNCIRFLPQLVRLFIFLQANGEDQKHAKHLEVRCEPLELLSGVSLRLPKKGLQAHHCLDGVWPSTFPWDEIRLPTEARLWILHTNGTLRYSGQRMPSQFRQKKTDFTQRSGGPIPFWDWLMSWHIQHPPQFVRLDEPGARPEKSWEKQSSHTNQNPGFFHPGILALPRHHPWP